MKATKNKQQVKHRMYCQKSGMRCAVYHADGICPDVTNCEGCIAEGIIKPVQKEEL